MSDFDVDVLIVGGGGCGLMSSIALSDMGVESLLVERHPTTSHLPKAHLLNQRTMEVFRQHGFADRVYEVGMPMEEGYCTWVTTLGGDGPLDGREIFRMDVFSGGSLRERYSRVSPCLHTNYPQIRLEPLLKDEAESRGVGRLRFNHELVDFAQSDDGVVATVLDRDNQKTYTVHAQYLVGADGGKTIGDKLGIAMPGPRRMMEMVTVHFGADLSAYLPDPTPMISWFHNPDMEGMWSSGAMVPLGPTWGPHSEEFYILFATDPDDPARRDDEACRAHIAALLNIPGLDIEVLKVSRWVLDGIVAERYRDGRVFLAGDAAHRHPPTTGLGLNTAITDAHNLAWKLKAVLVDGADPALLATYEQERLPVGTRNRDWALNSWFNHPVNDVAMGLFPGMPLEARQQTFAALFADNEDGELRRAKAREHMKTQKIEFHAQLVELGYAYRDGAVVQDGSPAPQRDPLGIEYHPSSRPGERLPHAWIAHNDQRLSTLDLIRPGRFLLLAGIDAGEWAQAATELAGRTGLPLDVVQFGPEYTLAEGEIPGLEPGGALLVRPDQHVLWRSGVATGDPAATLVQALAQTGVGRSTVQA